MTIKELLRRSESDFHRAGYNELRCYLGSDHYYLRLKRVQTPDGMYSTNWYIVTEYPNKEFQPRSPKGRKKSKNIEKITRGEAESILKSHEKHLGEIITFNSRKHIFDIKRYRGEVAPDHREE